MGNYWDDDYSYSGASKTTSKTASIIHTGSTKQSSKDLYGWDKHSTIDTAGAAYGDYDYDGFEVRPKTKQNYRKVLRAAYNCYRRGGPQLLDWVITAPEKAEYLLIEWYGEHYKGEMAEMVNSAPEEAADLIHTLFDDGSVSETDVQ
jgi:hypothetical protein